MKAGAEMMAKLAMLESQIVSMRQSLRGLEEEIPGVGDMLPAKFLHEGGGAGAPGIPKGIIVMWSGTTAPSGWHLCDGNNGTPDLRGRFVVGYKSDHVAPSTLPNENGDYTEPGNLSTGGATPGNTGGRDLHGYTENNHNNHDFVVDWRHSHKLTSDNISETEICGSLPDGSGVCEAGSKITVPSLSADYGDTDGVDDDEAAPGGAIPGDSAVDSTSPLDEGEFTNAGAKYTYTLKHTGATTEDTDNRPRYYVLAFIMKA